METHLDKEEIEWLELRYPNVRYRQQKVALAVMLKYFQNRRCYPSQRSRPPAHLINSVTQQLSCVDVTLSNFSWHYEHSTIQRFRELIRVRLNYRKTTPADNLEFTQWFKLQVAPIAPTPVQAIGYAENYFSERKLEPPTPNQLDRYLQSAQHQFESAWFRCLANQLPEKTKLTLDKFVGLHGDQGTPVESSITLHQLKQDLRKMDVDCITHFIERLSTLQALELPISPLKTCHRKLLLKYHHRILAERPSETREHSDNKRYSMLAVFCYMRKQEMLDALTQAFIDATRKIELKAAVKIKQDIISDVARVDGKFDLLHDLAELAANQPKGVIEKTIYPKVSKETLLSLVKELKQRGRWYDQQVKTKMRALYAHHHRKLLLPILQVLPFHCSHEDDQPIIRAIQWIIKHEKNGQKMVALTDDTPIEKVILKPWRSLVFEETNGKKLINRLNYELAIYETLRDKLDCKSIWISGAYRYRNPEEDLPQDMNENAAYYFKQLGLPEDADVYIERLKLDMNEHLKQLNDGLPSNHKVNITTKKGKPWIKVSPTDAQKPPENIEALKAEICERWPNLSLLDILKETAIRTDFLRHFHTVFDHEILKPEALYKRLLLCLNAMGTNIGLKRGSGDNTSTFNDLRYVKRRFITACRIREALKEVINQALLARDPAIFGEGNTTVACDSKKIAVWDQNLISQWHPRYKGNGVMVYWHVDQKALCVHSQLKTCLSSEVASLIQGILHHGTRLDIKSVTADTHGQSLPGFAFSHLLGFDLLPRIKGIQNEKLFLPDTASRDAYPELALILSKAIDWKLIRKNYRELVRYAAALKLRMVDSDIIFKRFKTGNYQHPVYKAILELGKAVKTIFLCKFLQAESLRVDIHASQNVVERVNGFMEFIFYGKLGEISTNKTQDQELAILCLHLIQASLSYINTLLIQNVLSSPSWQIRLTVNDSRALNTIMHGHLNPYGLFELDMFSRINIDTPLSQQESKNDQVYR